MQMFNSGVKGHYQSVFQIAELAKSNGIVFCGAGFWGGIAYQIFEKFGVYPCCFCDVAPEKVGKIYKTGNFYEKDSTVLNGDKNEIPVLQLQEAAEKYPNAIYIATVSSEIQNHNFSLRKVINSELAEKGLLSEYSGFHPMRYSFLTEWKDGEDGLLIPTDSLIRSEYIDKIVIFNHMSNSGSVYFDTLIDGHPQILNILLLGHYIPVTEIYNKRLQFLQDTDLAMEITSQMYVYFKSNLQADSFKAGYRLAEEYVVNEDGNPEERIYIDSQLFYEYVKMEVCGKGKLTFGEMLKAIYAAYYNTLGVKADINTKYWIFYHSHVANYDLTTLDEYELSKDFQRVEYLTIVRDVVRHLYSLIKRFNVDGDDSWRCWMGAKENYLPRFEGDFGKHLQKTKNTCEKSVHIIRFEDVKTDCEGFMKRLCKYLNVDYNDLLCITTVNALQVFFPVTSGKKEVLTGNDNRTVKQIDYSMLLSEYDIFRIKFIYQKFMQKYGYPCDVPDFQEFSMEFIEELLSKPFRFEKAINECTDLWNTWMGIEHDEKDYVHYVFTEMVKAYITNYEECEYFDMLPE